MSTLTLRNLPVNLHRALRVRAATHDRSIEAEVREILVNVVQSAIRVRMGDALAALGRKTRLTNKDIEVIERVRGRRPARPMKLKSA